MYPIANEEMDIYLILLRKKVKRNKRKAHPLKELSFGMLQQLSFANLSIDTNLYHWAKKYREYFCAIPMKDSNLYK